MSEERELSALRYPLALIACAATVCVWLPVLIGVGWFIFAHLDDWVDRQVWLLRVALQCGLGLVLLGILAVGCEVTKVTWYRITQPAGAVLEDGQKHGRLAKWRPGYDPSADQPAEPPAGGGEHGPCPKCGFTHRWNGEFCGHCGYGHD